MTPSDSKSSPQTRFARLDFGLIAVILLSLFTAIPLLSNAGLPNGSDVLYHTYRVAEMDRSWSHGLLTPRWAEGLYYGYGSPLFHYYASLTYYLTSILIRVFSMGALDTLRMVIVLSMIGCGTGMYLFTRERTGKLAGIIAALVYVYSPYLLYTEPYARGTYPELLAFALFPFIMWRFDRFIQTGRGRDFALAALGIFTLIITHNLMALTLTGLLLLWLVWGAVWSIRSGWIAIRPYALSLLAVGTGIGLAAYFWLPVLLESDQVNLDNLTGVALLDYRNFFVPLADLLAFPRFADLGAINGLQNVLILGVAQWGLALVGFVGMVIFAIRSRNAAFLRHPLFYAGCFLALLFLMTPAASAIWEVVSVLSFLQFPWRLLGAAAFCLAILAGMNAEWIQRLPIRWASVATGIIVALPIIFAFPLFIVPEWSNTSVDTTIADYHAAEVAGLQLGTTFTDEYRPRAVSSLADATPNLLADYADGYPIDKVNRSTLPASTSVELISNSPEYHVWKVTSDEPFILEVLNFDWAGWTATIDGEAVGIIPSLHHGFITFEVPVGEHRVEVYLGSTPARDLGNVISWITLVISIGIVVMLERNYRQSDQSDNTIKIADMLTSIRFGIIGGGLLALGLLALFFREGTLWVNSPAGEAIPAHESLALMLDDTFEVIGYDINGRSFRPGDRLKVAIYWHPLIESDINFSSFLHVSTWGPPLAQVDKLHPAGRAISEWWTPDGYILDKYIVDLPATLPPGEYNLNVGLYTCELMPADDCGNGYRPTVTDGDGEVIGDTVPLGTIVVR